MKEAYKFLFKFLTDPLSLEIDPLSELIILFVIGIIAFKIAWNISPGGKYGSLIHWTVRIIVFVLLWAIASFAIKVIQWIVENWILTLIIFFGVTIPITTFCHIIKKREGKK